MNIQNLWHKHFPKNGKKEKSRLVVKRQRQLRDLYEKQFQAITFAEAGLHDDARRILASHEGGAPKILVVSTLSTFRPEMVDYALRLALSLRCQIVALSVFSDAAAKKSAAAPLENLRWETFGRQAAEAAREFELKALNSNVSFRHMLRRAPLKKIIRQINNEVSRVRFIITAPEIEESAIKPEGGIPLFSFKIV